MTARFASNVIVLVSGAFMVCISLGLRGAAVGWVSLGVGCLVALTILVAFAVRGRGAAQRALDILMLAVAIWTVVASRTFSGDTLKWLVFSEGAVLAMLSLQGLMIHEALLELALGSLQAEADRSRAPAAPAVRPGADEGSPLGLTRRAS